MQTNFSAADLIKKGMSDTPAGQKRGKIAIGVILAVVTVAALYMAMPFLLPVVAGIESIASSALKIGVYSLIGGSIFFFLKAQWRNIGYINEYFARRVFAGIITYDPFLIQEKQINSAEHDVEKMMEEKAIIDGKYVELSKKIAKYNNDFLASQESANLIAIKLRTENEQKKIAILKLDADDCVRQGLSCKNYIDSIGPIANDMKFMIEFISEGYQVLKRRIKSAKQDLAINKDIFESAHAGGAALERMKRAMVGDIQLNSDAEKAQLAVMQNIALTVGQMRVSMEIISDVTRTANLEEGGHLAVARKQLESLNLISGQAIPVTQATSNFNNVNTLKDLRFDLTLPED